MSEDGMVEQGKRIALVTGAAGGMGATCARRLGREYDVFLCDIDDSGLNRLHAELADEGIAVAGSLAIDLGENGSGQKLVGAARECGTITAVVHTAGLSPSLGDAAALMRLNAGGTQGLLDALEAVAAPGLAVVVIASMAGHTGKPDAAIDGLCAAPTRDGFLEEVVALLVEKAGGENGRKAADAAYVYSKRANLLDVQRRAPDWAAKGGRINSISPGLVDTGMGRKEVESDKGAAQMLAAQPLGWISPADIAEAAVFLTSPSSQTITGTDLKVDGGVCAAIFGGRSTTGACAA